MATRFFIPYLFIKRNFYTLQIQYSKLNTRIIMNVHNSLETTDDLPRALSILQSQLPNIFTSQCFNDLHLSFYQEAKHTEIGHLFEHILLEYLCSVKSLLGYETVEFSGTTRWDWAKNPRGTFSIHVSSSDADKIIFNEALKKTIRVMDTIFEESVQVQYYKKYSSNLSSTVVL